MGKLALLLVLAVSMSVGVVSLTLNRTKISMVTRVAGFQKYSYARNIAHAGVNAALRAFDRNDTSVIYPLERGRTVAVSSNLMDGTSYVTIKLPPSLKRDTLDLTSLATYNDSTYTMKLRLRRTPKPFPAVNACVGFASAEIDYNIDGKPHIITGQNYNMDGTRGNPALDTNGVTTKTRLDSGVVATADWSRITGDPYKVKVEPPDDPAAYVDEYIQMADYVFADGSSNNDVYGSVYAPVIGYCKGNVKMGGSGKFYGVLIVNGTLDLAGTFDIYGLIICYGNDIVISVGTSAGNPSLYGGLIMSGGPGSQFTLKGTPQMYYSVEALKMAQYIGKMQAYQVVYWYYQ